MAVGTIKSENVTNIEASPITALDKKAGEVKVIIDQDSIPTTATDDVGDISLFGPIPSDAVILDVEILNDDLAATNLAVDCGLYYSGIGGSQSEDGNSSGTVIDADCFASASAALQTAAVTWTSLRFEADDIIDVKKEAWAVGNLSADPGGLFYVGLTVTTAAGTPAVGDIVMRVTYI